MKSKKTTLTNGLRILFVPMEDNPTVTVAVLVGTGSEYEKQGQFGVAHFLEHMCFKGTAKRPGPGVIARELEGLGAATNAFTGRRYTGYYAKAQSRHVHKIFDVVADLYLNPTFPEPELEREKGVVIEEINMYDDMPQRQVSEVFDTLMYGESPAGRPIIGTRESVRAFTRNDLQKFRDAHYHPANTVIVAAGSFDECEVKKDIVALFGELAPGKKNSIARQKPQNAKSPVSVKEKKSGQSHIVLGMPAVHANHNDEPALRMLASVLGGGMSSRLFQKLREEMGVCYYVFASLNTSPAYGDLTIQAGVPKGRVGEVVSALSAELERLREELVDEKELRIVKNYLVGSMMLGLESSDDLAFYFGMQEVLNQSIQMPRDRAKELRAVTPADIRRVARKYLTPDAFRLALIGPKQDAAALGKILRS